MLYTQKVKYYSNEDHETHVSTREYFQIDSIVGTEETGDYYRHNERTELTIFLDPQTGLVVFDVEAYERWITQERTANIQVS